jgi:hypothetical protein
MLAWFAVNWLVLAGLYLAFTGQASAVELAVALCGGFATMGLRLAVSRFGRPYASGSVGALALSVRVLPAVCHDVGKLTLAFLKLIATARMPQGSFVDIAFDPGDGEASSRSRRSLVVSGISFAPNTYVVAIRFAERRLVLHALLPAPEPGDVQWPL